MKVTRKLHLVAGFVLAIFASQSYAAGCNPSWYSGSYTKTQNPILLVHGITGFDSIGGLIDYFFNIPSNLCRSGATVKVAQVSPFNSSEQRGAELASDINNNVYGSGKFNIIAHSQGSPTSRVAITHDANMNSYGNGRIVSLTSIGGVNKGSRVADVVDGVVSDSFIEGGAAAIANAFGSFINLISGGNSEQDALEALRTLTTDGTEDLNDNHPYGVASSYCSNDRASQVNVRGNNIRIYSFAGTSPLTNVLDLSDAAFAITTLAFLGERNDGLVAECSQKLGYYLGRKTMNHADEVNQILGVRSLFFNPVSMYRSHANRLKNAGL